ncbi:MAG: GNA1162 family protein [Fibrobacterota bacterium]
MRYLLISAILSAAFLLGGCASATSRHGYKADSFFSPLPVAVLPVNNMSNDLKAADMFRELFKNALQDLGYPVAKNDDVDFLLQRNGFSDGGQLARVEPQQLCEMLGVDAVFLGTLEKANQLTTGVYNKKEVRASLRLYRGSSLLWSDTAEAVVKETRLSGKAIGDAFVQRASGKALSKFNGHPLLALTEQMIYDLQQKLPGNRIETTGWEPRNSQPDPSGAQKPPAAKRAK